MAALLIHDPKRVVDLITLSFDFTSDLIVGETISTAVASATVFTGSDPSPSDVLYQLTTIIGDMCTQKMWKGLSGVVYDVLMTIVTNTGRTVEQVVRVAIRPDDTHGQGLYIPLYYTSRPYPYYFSDQITGNTTLSSGMLKTIIINYAFSDKFSGSTILTSGILRSIIITYSNMSDSMSGSTILTSGTLHLGVVTYTDIPDAFIGSALLKSGTLTIGLVTYNNPADSMQGTTILTSGTLG